MSSRSRCGEPDIYRQYKYPDGRILKLTKQEFDAIVDVFRMLAQQDARLRKNHSITDLKKMGLKVEEE